MNNEAWRFARTHSLPVTFRIELPDSLSHVARSTRYIHTILTKDLVPQKNCALQSTSNTIFLKWVLITNHDIDMVTFIEIWLKLKTMNTLFPDVLSFSIYKVFIACIGRERFISWCCHCLKKLTNEQVPTH